MSSVRALVGLVFLEIYRKKDFYVALILMAVILVYASQIEVYNFENIVRYVREIGLMLIYLFSIFLAVPLAARQLAAERDQRTLAVLLAKPVTRGQFIVGKSLGAFLASLSAFLIFYSVFILVTLAKGKMGSPVNLIQAGYLFSLSLLVVTAMASALSYFLTSPAAMTLAFVFYFLMSLFGARFDRFAEESVGLARPLGKAVYYLLPHFEFFDLRQRVIHDWDPVSWGLIAIITAYAVLYTALFLFSGWLKFRRQPL
ncbi:MAG: ABC transporter permease subunit [Candidatus Omnitrophica bacterium]|nr:ABC transporter permease subunit [Candidatus Omnitrophota bacterium]